MTHKPLDGIRLDAQSGTTKSLVILIHGYGANANDLIDLGRQWGPLFPDTAFVSVNAPERCPISPTGLQWFKLTHNPGGMRSAEEYWNGVCHSEEVLQAFIDSELEKHGLDETKCVLVGFSQGTMMALHVGLRRKKQLAGIIAYSGVLAGSEKIDKSIKVKPPVLLVHGEDDPVIPVEALSIAKQALRTIDVDPEWHIVADLGHGIDALGFQIGYNFMKRMLP